MIPSGSISPKLVKKGESLDTWGRGSFRIIQEKKGYRFSLDSLILSAFTPLGQGARVLDLGTGCGILALLLAGKFPSATVFALEWEPTLADLASRNVRLNGLQDRVFIIRGDLKQLPSFFQAGTLDAVVMNPPYRPLNSGRINPHPQKAVARHEIQATLEQCFQATAHGLKEGGKLFMIYPVRRLVGLLVYSRRFHLEPKRMRLAHSFQGKPAQWVLLEATFRGREELMIPPPLIVYERIGVYSPELQKSFPLGKSSFSPGPTERAGGPRDS